MSIRQTVLALALVGASIPAAFANSGATLLTTDRGFEFQPTQSTKSRADVMKELEASKNASAAGMNRSPSFNRGDSGYVNEQHSFVVQGGRLVHTDTLAHNTPKPSLAMTAAEQRLSRELNRN